MKKFLLSLMSILIVAFSFAQTTVCFNSFEVQTNGNGGNPATFPGYLSQSADATYGRSGKVELRFSTALPAGVNPPEITSIREILPTTPATYGPYLDLKFALENLVLPGRVIAEYAFYGALNLNNGSSARYEVGIKYDATGGNSTSICNVIQTPDPIPLPVTFKSFKADRKTSSSVGVTWTTASEQNNKGFFIQRNDGSGWKNVAFVFSAANGGNSTSDLSYSFNDVNTETAISQYRVQQVDLDGMARYSTISAVRGLGVSTKLLVYPNPTSNGKVNVVFDDNNSVRDVQVSDAAGRTIKQFKSITNNLLLIENLKSGFYTIKVTNRNTAATTVEKVVVK